MYHAYGFSDSTLETHVMIVNQALNRGQTLLAQENNGDKSYVMQRPHLCITTKPAYTFSTSPQKQRLFGGLPWQMLGGILQQVGNCRAMSESMPHTLQCAMCWTPADSNPSLEGIQS